MNKRQLKKKVKQAKLNKERGLILDHEEWHFIRNYSKYYYTQRDIETYVNVLDGMQSLADKVIRAMINKTADSFKVLPMHSRIRRRVFEDNLLLRR